MANQKLSGALPGDVLLVIHDFNARSPDELSLKRGEKIELIEKDDDFGDGWFLGRHLSKDDNGLFPAVYTTIAPKPTSQANPPRRAVAHQSSASNEHQIAELMGSDEHMRAPSVQPPAASHPPAAERSFSAPLTSPVTPPSNSTPSRPQVTTMAQRSISMSNGAHQNSPVMNETLSVIEEHITDLSTPRHSLIPTDRIPTHNERPTTVPQRLSYIHGPESDEEESHALTADEVQQWDPDRVAEYLEDIGVDQQHCKVFREQEITGEVLLGMDQGSLMLKEFELGSIGKRLALWQKVKAMQEEIKTGVVRRGSGQYPSSGDGVRNRSTSVGLPRIPSLMDGRTPSRQNSLQRSPTKTHSRYNDSTASMPAPSEAHHGGHTPRPSAASIRDIAHSRRHSSIGEALASPTSIAPAESPIVHKHNKQGSFDTGWTMVDAPSRSSAQGTPQDATFQTTEPPTEVPTPSDHGMLVVSSLDLDRGYFSGNEVDNRDRTNKLRKKHGADLHGRAPSDSYGTKRLSAVFRSKRAGSTESLDTFTDPSTTQLFYGKGASAAGRSPGAPPKAGHRKYSSVSPTVTKLEYGDSPSIDAVTASPQIAGSETSSIERSSATKSMFNRTRATGLRAISDAITGDEKKTVVSPKSINSEKGSYAAKESPLQSPGSSTPSINSKSFEGTDETALLKTSTSSGRQTPILPRRKGKKSTSAYTRGLEKKSPKEMITGCDYSGWMKKKSSNLMTTWKTRLFVLRGTRLSYFYTEGDTEEKGLIDISFHRVLPANNDRILGLHATFTGAGASPTSPQNAQIETAAQQDAQKAGPLLKGDDSGMFIFKLVPPRAGLSKAVNFTKPTVHYFAVDNIQQGRLWMAALMKATIERDDAHQVITTYKEKTISLAKAKAMRHRPPALMGDDDESAKEKEKEREKENEKGGGGGDTESGLRISFVNGDTDTATITTNGDKEGSFTTGGATSSVNPSTENLAASPPVGS